MKRVVVLGSTGMLGHKVFEHFSNIEDYEVFGSYRSETVAPRENAFYFDATNPDWSSIPDCDYIINCIGIIKPFMKDNIVNAIKVNSLFPWELSQWCLDRTTRLIHITTDCVYSGNKGGYDEDIEHDALDAYGKSKSLGEPKNCMVIRTSIVGTEIHKNASFISWALSQKEKETNGFTNHYWNGITTNQYAKCCEKIIRQGLYQEGVRHIFSPEKVTKYQMVEVISNVFDLKIKINPFETSVPCDRSISTKYDLCSILQIPSFRVQIEELNNE